MYPVAVEGMGSGDRAGYPGGLATRNRANDMNSAGTGVELARAVERSAGLQPWRRVLHAFSGLVLVVALRAFDPPVVLVLTALSVLLALQLILDGVRLAVPRANLFFFRTFTPLVSPRESEGIASSTWYVLGALLALALFPRPAAMGGIVVLAVADPTANLVGRLWGRVRIGSDGTVEGTVAFFLAGFLALLLLADPRPPPSPLPPPPSWSGAPSAWTNLRSRWPPGPSSGS